METAPVVEISLREKLLDVHSLRVKHGRICAVRLLAEADFKEKHAHVYQAEAQAAQDLAEAQDAVRLLALAAYDGENKAVTPGVAIREVTEYDYTDDEAYAWAKNHGLCLKLDAKAFKDVCRVDRARPSFVGVRIVPTATIAQDLGKALRVEDADAQP